MRKSTPPAAYAHGGRARWLRAARADAARRPRGAGRARLRLALSVPVVDRAVGAAQHHLVGGVARPDAELVAIGVDGDGRLARAGEHHDPRCDLVAVAHLVGAGRTGREAHQITAAQLLLASGRAQQHDAVEHEQPLLLVLVVVGADVLAG